jgi:adenylylsulfate kinase
MHIHPDTHRFLHRRDKETLLGQRGIVVWLCGLSGSGKSTLANAVERVLHQQGRFTAVLDGDNLRAGLSANLGFTDQDRLENIRRIAETAKLFVSQGIITIVSAITPRGELRDLARGLLGSDLIEVYVKASYETCEKRDVKGLYARAARGEIQHFTGKDGSFEPPQSPDLVLNTETSSIEDAAFELLETIRERIAI